jgi:tRNA wybutosine-synthesizing protein 2
VSTLARAGRASKPKPISPIEAAIRSWLEILPPELVVSIDSYLKNLLSKAPKRWVVYPPMVLLPAGSFGEQWWEAVGPQQVASRYAAELWTSLLETIGRREGKGTLTHLAVNSGIPLQKSLIQGPGSQGLRMLASGGSCSGGALGNISDHGSNLYRSRLPDSENNILRTPCGLIMLHGDFGPSLFPETVPTERDFEEAFWVSTKQNGITQFWAPRYTMFSRGNVKEKARLLDFHRSDQSLVSRRLAKDKIANDSAVDLYAGIGYFVFSYLKLGLRRVVGWELNPWSVEGLRRGAIANGWSVEIVRSNESLDHVDGQIVVLLEDNRNAAERLRGPLRHKLGSIRHVNCGLLPSSEDSWEMALGILDGDGWVHLHENVGVKEIQARTAEIEKLMVCWLNKTGDERSAKVEHVEYVKTFAPDVWHCVFDVYISRLVTQP